MPVPYAWFAPRSTDSRYEKEALNECNLFFVIPFSAAIGVEPKPRAVGFAGSFRSCRAIQGGFLLLAMLVSYLVNDTWSLPSLSRSTGMGS